MTQAQLHDIRNNIPVHEASITNTSMEAQLGDTVSLSTELRNSSQEATSGESMCDANSHDVVFYTSSSILNPPDSSQDITPVQNIVEPVSQSILTRPLDCSQDVTTTQNNSEPASQDGTTRNSHDKTSSCRY